MTRNKAYEVLGIDSNASTEEIKTAYAELSKKYHPEENPEEFQEIHEAYSLLVRGNRTRRQTTKVDVVDFQMRQQPQTETSFDDDDFSNVDDEKILYEEELPQFDFDSVENQAQQEIPEEFLIELQTAIDKLDLIIPPLSETNINPNILEWQMKKLKLEIMLCPPYVNKLYTIFQTREVDRESHRIIIEYMRLWDEVLLQENEYLAAFRAFLDQKKEAYYTPEQLRKDRNTALVFLIILFVGLFATLFWVLK